MSALPLSAIEKTNVLSANSGANFNGISQLTMLKYVNKTLIMSGVTNAGVKRMKTRVNGTPLFGKR
jgi:hypothetical protein